MYTLSQIWAFNGLVLGINSDTPDSVIDTLTIPCICTIKYIREDTYISDNLYFVYINDFMIVRIKIYKDNSQNLCEKNLIFLESWNINENEKMNIYI